MNAYDPFFKRSEKASHKGKHRHTTRKTGGRSMSIKVGDMVIYRGGVWSVTGIHLGALRQQSVVTMRGTIKRPPDVHGKPVDELVVPIELTDGRTYRRVEDAA
jgi:hypothetical protein